jgi:hypothetical protein
MKSKSSTKPIKEFMPTIQGAASGLTADYNANKAGTAQIANSITSRLPALADKAFGPNSLLDSAQGYATDTINGKFLNNNPYVDEMAGIARRSAADDVQSYFGKLGRVGSDSNMAGFARGVNEADLGVRSSIYNQERQNQQQAASMAPGLNAASYDGIDAYLRAAGVGAELPYLASNKYASGIGGLLGQYTKTKSTQAIGPALISAAGSAASAFAGSDARLKTRIQKVGSYDDGLGIYDFDYIDDLPEGIKAHCPEGRQRGVMASEVQKLRPWALGPVVDGYATVNYGAL